MRYLFLFVPFLLITASYAQEVTSIKDLTFFKEGGSTWKMAGEVVADLETPNVLHVKPGDGILVNIPDKKNKGKDLFTIAEFGDMDLELEFMMAKASNSGIYLHGRYEVQLLDSWNLSIPTAGSNGGIYQRWDDSRPEGEKGYEGYAPRQNASRAPGLWQKLRISFQAPRFDVNGKKTSNAKILMVELNGVLIHEGVELSGPTRGGAGEENATGPLRIQGDHGAVAFRNIKVTNYAQSRPAQEPGRPGRVYPILVEASENPVFRSFMDLPGGKRVVHAVSVGSRSNVHYTYDMDNGMLLQVWRGGFLDATPMWFSRGDGSSRPTGAVQTFGDPAPSISKLPSKQTPWKSDTSGTAFKTIGYRLNTDGNPVFLYESHGWKIDDAISALPSGEGIARELIIKGDSRDGYLRLAEGKNIKQVKAGLYVVDDNSWFLQLDPKVDNKPFVRTLNGRQELLVPVAANVKYSILF
jgi:hypothetical protein